MKKNVLVIVIALTACVGLLITGLTLNRGGVAPANLAPLEGGIILRVTPDNGAPFPTSSQPPADASSNHHGDEHLYLVVTVNNITYDPIPLTGDDEYLVAQKDVDASNTIRVSKDSVSMFASSCTNQDCILQGTVTSGNKESRVLGNMIVCLPNKVTLQLCTAEDVSQMLAY